MLVEQMGNVGSSEVAAAAVGLCSAEASYVFEQALVDDGGMTIGGFEFS